MIVCDVGLGCSVGLPDGSRHPMRPAWEPGGACLGVAAQADPWMILDLGASRAIGRIRVFNTHLRPDPFPFELSCSEDAQAWRKLAVIHYRFGGHDDGKPLELAFRVPMGLRYLKLRKIGTTDLRIDYIEASVAPPTLPQGSITDLRVLPDILTATYRHQRDFGYAWGFTTTLYAILAARRSGIAIERIDYSAGFDSFKNVADSDLYEALFEPCGMPPPGLPALKQFDHHSVYADLPPATYAFYLATYFRPSPAVLARAAAWRDTYRLDPANGLAIVFRGTDKAGEVTLAPIEAYIEAARTILADHPGLQLCVQTDQAEALEAVLASFPDAIHIRELPVTTGRQVIHRLPVQERFGITKLDLATGLLAMIQIYAGFRFLVSHTGNIALWLALYRGHADGLYQFDRQGVLRGPDGKCVQAAP